MKSSTSDIGCGDATAPPDGATTTDMMFVCYSVAFAILAFGHEYPDSAMLIVLLVLARFILRQG